MPWVGSGIVNSSLTGSTRRHSSYLGADSNAYQILKNCQSHHSVFLFPQEGTIFPNCSLATENFRIVPSKIVPSPRRTPNCTFFRMSVALRSWSFYHSKFQNLITFFLLLCSNLQKCSPAAQKFARIVLPWLQKPYVFHS